MFDTYFEQQAAMNDDSYTDYKSNEKEDKLYAVCKCKGRPPTGESDCVRNPARELSHRGQGWCLWYLPNGSAHCGHRFPPEKK